MAGSQAAVTLHSRRIAGVAMLALPALLAGPAVPPADAAGSGATTSDAPALDLAAPAPANPAAFAPPTSDAPTATTTRAETSGDARCERSRAPARRRRFVVVSHPYDAAGRPSDRYSVLSLDGSGELAPTGHTFRMGRALGGPVVFTPDGEIGVVAQADGSLGLFRLAADGRPQVLYRAYRSGFSAAAVVFSPRGDEVYVLDPNWREHGGGIYRLRLSCDGRLSAAGPRAPAKLAYAMLFVWRRPQVALVAARDLLDRGPGAGVFLLDWSRPRVLSAADAFGDEAWIGSSAAVTPDGRYLLLADHNASPDADDRVAVVAIHRDELVPRQIVAPVVDPVAVAISPFNNAAVVLSGFGNAVVRLSYDAGNSRTPFAVAGEPRYRGRGPRLPSGVAVVGRGPLIGRTLVAENRGVRQLKFTPSGDLIDLGLAGAAAASPTAVTGAIGVQP